MKYDKKKPFNTEIFYRKIEIPCIQHNNNTKLTEKNKVYLVSKMSLFGKIEYKLGIKKNV